MISKFIFYILLLFSFSLFSCSGGETNQSDEEVLNLQATDSVVGIDVNEIIQRGKLIAITNNTPTSYFIYRGRPMGYQYDLLKRFADFLNVELEIKIVASIPDAIDSLKQHKADIVASGLTVLGDRKVDIDFSIPIIKTHQILVQRIPNDLLSSSPSLLEKRLLRDVTELAGKDVYVEEGSSYYNRLLNLQEEIGDSIHIHTYSGNIDIDSILNAVSTGKVDYVISEDYTTRFFMRYYDNLDISTPVSFNQNIAWAAPKNSESLIDTINHWINKHKRSTTWAILYNQYFKYSKKMSSKVNSEFTMENGVISKYDKIIKTNADKIGWNWMLVAAQISVESGFKPNNHSWAGAQGLMQLMPATAHGLGGGNLDSPSRNIALGVKYDGILFEFWKDKVPDSLQAIKFALASYNIGKGHILDARRLAKQYGLDPEVWDDNVEVMIKNLSRSKYYRDPVVKYGYCRGQEAFNYVKRIFYLYDNYKNFESAPS